jgi:hypothetical protein
MTNCVNPRAFQAPPPLLPSGQFQETRFVQIAISDIDLSVFNTFTVYREASLQFRAESFNLTNTVVFTTLASTVGSPTFWNCFSYGKCAKADAICAQAPVLFPIILLFGDVCCLPEFCLSACESVALFMTQATRR